MLTDREAILQAALELSDEDRQYVFDELLVTLPPPGFVELSEEEFHAELIRRCEDKEPGIPWEVVRDELREMIDADPDD